MKLRHIGYACINRTLDLTTGRTLRLSNLTEEYAAEVTSANLSNLVRILEWNVEHSLHMFRISSSAVPFASHPEFSLDWRAHFADELAHIRRLAEQHELRLSMHPGQYTVLNSKKDDVVERAIAELDYHARFLEAITPDGGDIVLHVGGAYGDKETSMRRFATNFRRLSSSARRQLVIENDDTVYNVDEVLELCAEIGRPLVFDIFHHQCNPPSEQWRDDLIPRLEAVVATWDGQPPKCHISTGREGTRTSHADYISAEDFEVFVGLMGEVDADAPFDLMVEAKEKDKAALRLL